MKVSVGIIGTGNIGTDLLCKILRSNYLECSLFMGRRTDSDGIRFAQKLGVRTSILSLGELMQQPDLCKIIFDATDAKTHVLNVKKLEGLNIDLIDLTPARIGKMCVPAVNLSVCDTSNDVNMITCGGQATIPLIQAVVNSGADIRYVEVVSNIASKSAGMGTRNNIDEFTQTTKEAIVEITGIQNAKTIITLNPAEPPVHMHNTIFMLIDHPDMEKIQSSVFQMVEAVKQYVPGYRLTLEPTYENGRVTTAIEVVGAGDYLPTYAGNLDIITHAAVRIAEYWASTRIGKYFL